MRRIGILVMFELISIGCFSQVNKDSVIFWTRNFKLNATDFMGTIPDSISNTVAVTMTKIEPKALQTDKYPNYMIVAIFIKSGSWIKDSSKSVLIHEQLHFDIAELYARKMRKRIAELRSLKKTNVYDYNTVFIRYWDEFEKKSNEYDKQTHHGINSIKQKEWNLKIKEELNNLNKYEIDYLK